MDTKKAHGDGQEVKITLPQSLLQRLQKCVHPEKQSPFYSGCDRAALKF